MKTKKEIQKIRKILKSTEVEFTIKNRSEVFHTACLNSLTSENASIWNLLRGMNVEKWGPTCVTLYTYDMLGNKTTGKIKYLDVENLSPVKK